MKSAVSNAERRPRLIGARQFFENSIRHGRMAHACVLLGPKGSGMTEFALEVARMLLCESGCPAKQPACAVCRQIESGNHPDVQLIAPAAPGGRVLIADTREMRRQAYMARFRGKYRVFIVDGADRMGEAAQNQVLKVLEEPPPNTVILLLAAGTAGLLETVLSRCAVVRLGGLSGGALIRKLGELGEFSDRDIAQAVRFSRGSYSRAEMLLKANAAEFSDMTARAILSGAADADMDLADVLKNFSSSGDNTKERRIFAAEAFEILAIMLRDALMVKLDMGPENVYNMEVAGEADAADPGNNIVELSQFFTTEDILDLLLISADMQRGIGQNLNIELLCDFLAQEVFERKLKTAT